MAFYQPQDLTSALLPTTFFYWILGMGVIEYPVGNPRRIFSSIYSSIICIIFAIAVFLSYDLIELGGKTLESSIGSFGVRIYTWMAIILTFVVIIVSIGHNRKRNDCVNEVMDIGGTMQRIGVTCPYRIIFVRQIWQLFGSMLLTLMINTFEFVFLAQYADSLGWLTISSSWYFQNFLVLLSTVGDIAFCTVIGWSDEVNGVCQVKWTGFWPRVIEFDANGISSSSSLHQMPPAVKERNNNWVMTTYFKDLNSLLESMKVNPLDEYTTRMGNLIQVDAVIANKQKLERLHCIRMIHSRLVRVAKRWTDLNAVHILSTVVTALPILTVLAHSTYTLFSNLKYLSYDKVAMARNFLWIIFWSGKVFNIVGTTAILTSEAKRTGEILLTYLHPIAFLRSEVITSISTYLVLLIQTRNA